MTTPLDEHILQCPWGSYPWDQWQTGALAAGLAEELAALGRAVMREAYQHDWRQGLQRECGWSDAGAGMLRLALCDPDQARRRWNYLLATDGGNYPEGASLLND